MNIQNRILLFFFGCVPIRLFFVLLSRNMTYLPYMGYLAIIGSLLFFNKYMKNDSKVGFFGGNVWWNNMRLFHSIMYMLFGIAAINKKEFAWKILLIDIIVGILAFINQYYFKK